MSGSMWSHTPLAVEPNGLQLNPLALNGNFPYLSTLKVLDKPFDCLFHTFDKCWYMICMFVYLCVYITIYRCKLLYLMNARTKCCNIMV